MKDPVYKLIELTGTTGHDDLDLRRKPAGLRIAALVDAPIELRG